MAVAVERPPATGAEPVGTYFTDGTTLLELIGLGAAGAYFEDCLTRGCVRRDPEGWEDGLRVVEPEYPS